MRFQPDDQALREIGLIAVLAGAVRFSLLCGVNTLYFTRLGDQGVGSLTMRQEGFGRLCLVLQRLLAVRGAPEEMVTRLGAFAARYAAPMQDAADIAGGMWTCLGGEPVQIGLFRDTVLRGSDLCPHWRKFTTGDLTDLARTLDAAAEEAATFSGLHLIAVVPMLPLSVPPPPTDVA